MRELELQLAELAEAIDWPPTPHVAITLPERSLRPWFARNRWAMAAAAAAVIAATLLAYTPSREAIAGWVNLHVFIQRSEHPPTPTPLPSGSLGSQLGLGRQMSLAQAEEQVTWRIEVPATLGRPDAVYYQAPPAGPAGGEVSLVYAARAGIPQAGQTGLAVLITEARGKVDQNFFGKMLGPSSTLEQFTLNGDQAFWITGPMNVFVFIDANGDFRTETMRLAANTLIFDDHGTVVRIEGDLTRQQAVQIAASTS